MKKLTTHSAQITLLLLAIVSMESCWWGSGGSSSYSTYSMNKEDFFKGHSYNSDKTFKLADGTIDAPLLSHKGQFNMTLNLKNGTGFQVAAAVSPKVAILLGGLVQSRNEESQHGRNVPVTQTYYNGTSSSTSQVDLFVDYHLHHKMTDRSFYAAVGMYKTFAQAGRWENYAGIVYGKTSNTYSYEIKDPVAGNYSFTESRQRFQLYIQDNLGFVTRHTEGALITRLSYVHFMEQQFEKSFDVPAYAMTSDNLVFQPAVKFGWGGRVIRLYLQYGWNFSLGNNDLNWYSNNVQAGILFRINDKVNY